VAGTVALVLATASLDAQDGQDGPETFRFRSGVDLVNVTATVTDSSGRFVSGLGLSDFSVYEDDRLVDVTHFSAERVPVSLGIVLDTSGSMVGDKIVNARAAIERFLDQLLNPDDEIFLIGFSDDIAFRQDWTRNREALSTSLRRIRVDGGTAMYDAMLEAVPIAQGGRNRKKAVVLISDGNDTNSRAAAEDVQRVVRESEVLVYAVGIDGDAPLRMRRPPPRYPPMPFPIPGRRRPGWPTRPQLPPTIGIIGGLSRLNVAALREMTDSSGGRTEIVRSARDLDGATLSIADELGQQYYLGYASPGDRDGRWHTIRVEARDPSLRVRARRGYVATP
jgi:VWFA-related protein